MLSTSSDAELSGTAFIAKDISREMHESGCIYWIVGQSLHCKNSRYLEQMTTECRVAKV